MVMKQTNLTLKDVKTAEHILNCSRIISDELICSDYAVVHSQMRRHRGKKKVQGQIMIP